MSKSLWIIAWHEYVTNVRRPGFIFATLLVPALGLIGLVVATFFSGQAGAFFESQFLPAERKPLGVVDHSGLFAEIPPQYVDKFIAWPDEAAARQAFVAGTIAAYIVIPADYLASGQVTAYTSSSFSGIVSVETEDINPFLLHGLLAGKVDEAVLARATDPGNFDQVALDAQGQAADSEPGSPLAFMGGMFASLGVSILLFISIMVSSNYLLRSVSEEKENRVMEIVVSSVSTTDLLWGKVIGLGALGLTQVGVWLLSGIVLTGGLGAVAAGVLALLSPGVIALALVYFVLGYLLYGVLMAAAGSLGTSMRESQQIGGLFSFAAALPWMINGFLFANPNFVLARLLSWFPLTAPMMMMLRLPYGTVPTIDIIGSLAVLALSVPAVMWAGAKVFRTSLLMYGKRLSVKEVVAALRRA
jgi:ABC-2 type transport system permease protein